MSSLSHHGIKGQRWGIRRFQNKDGTLTAAGRKRQQYLIEVGSGKRKRLVEAAKSIGTSGDYSRDVTGLNKRGIRGRVINEDDNTHIIKKGTSIYRTATNSELNDDGTYASLTKNDVDRYIDYGRSGDLPGADKSNLDSMKIFEFSANRDLKIANGKYITEIITDDVKRRVKNGDADQVKLGKEILESFKRYEENLNLSFSTSEMRRSKEAASRTEKEKEFDRDLVSKASDRLALYDKTILDYSSGKDYRVIRDRLKREGYDGFIDVEDVTTIENLVRGGANTEYPVVILNANDVLTLKRSIKESETQRRLKRGTKFNSSRGELDNVVQHTSIGGTMYIEGNALILGDSSYLEHHGILGQKWGVRRFQNKDGTRTAAGKAREDRRVLKKGTTVKRTSYGMYDETYDNKKYVSTNDDDAGKWSRYIGEAKARQGAVVFENEYKLTRDVAVATGKDICKIIDSEFKNADVTKLKEDTDYAARALRQDLNNMSREERVSLNFAMQTQSGKKIVKLLKKHGYDALEDDHGKNVSKDPVIILDPEKNMKRTRVTANTRYYFNYINHTSIDDSPHLSHHGIKGQRWGVRRFQNKDGTRTAAGKKREAESLKSSQEAKNVNSKIHSYINKQLSSEDLDTGKSNYDFASHLIKDPDFEKVIMPVVQDIRQTKAKYGNKEPYEFTGDEHQAYMNDISRIDNKTGELAITIGLAEKGESHKKSTPPEGEYERVDMFRYALARYLDEHSPDGYSDEGDWIYHTSIGGTMYIEGNALILGDSSYLEHHGIRGQKWGVRRFQNRDGSLTNAGRKRLGYATKGAVQTVGKAFKAGVKAGGNAVKAAKAHHEKKEAEKLQKKKEKASKTRLGVMANKDLFTNEEIRKLNERFKLEDEMKMATLQKGVEIAKAVGTIAQNVGTVAKTYEDVTGQSLSPIKRKAAEEKARQDKEDRERRIAREDADEARKVAKEERDIAIHEQTLRKAIASADTQEFTAQKTKAEADSSILDLYKKGQDFNGGSDATGQSWMEKAKNGGKNPFDDMIANRDPEYAQIRKEHDEKVARKERIAELERREKEREAEKAAAKKQSAPQQKQGGGDDDALFSQKGSLPIDKDRYRNNRAMEKAKQVKEDAAEERAKKQDEKAAKATIDDMMEARRQFTDSARANSNGAFDRETAANYIKGKAKELPNKLNPVNAIAKKITNKALKEEEDNARKALENEYKKTSRSQGRDEANYTMYYNRVNALQAQGYSERQAKKVADTESPFSSKRNRRFEYNEKVGKAEETHRKNKKEINKAETELDNYFYKIINTGGDDYLPGKPKRTALEKKYADKLAELDRLRKDNDAMLERERKEAKQILEHSLSIQNGVLFINAGEPYLEHHGVKGQRWGVRRFQNEDGSLTDKGRKHYEKALAKEKRKQVSSDAIRGTLERQHPFAVAASVALGATYAAMLGVASAAAPGAVVAGAAIAAAISGVGTHGLYSVSEAWEGRGTRMRSKKIAKYENMLKQSDMEEGMYHVENGTLFINAGEPYLEHHGVKGMKWGKHLMAGKGVDAEGGGGGGFAEDDEKLKEMAKKAGMSVAEYKQKFASKIGGAASKVSVKDKHLVVNGTRSLAVGETGEKPKSFKEKAYNALGGKYKTQAADAHREMIQKRNDADDKARRANAQGRAANANKKAGNVREYMANKEGARQLDAEAKGARVSQWEATKKANSAQWKYDHSLAGLYDKATGKYKQAHKKTAVPKMMDRWKYELKAGPNSKLFNNGKGKAKTAKEQAKAEVWTAADHQIKAKEHNDLANSLGGNTNYFGQMLKKESAKEARLAEGSYRRAAALGKQASRETSTSSRPRARKKKYTSGGSGVNVRRPGRKPVSRTKRVTQSSTGVKRRGATGSGARVRRGA